MLDNTCIPNMRTAQLFDFSKCLQSEIGHFTTTIGRYVSIIDTMVVIISKQAGEYLIDDYFLFVIHIE